MTTPKLHILLADDDQDDCLLFQDALNELPVPVQLTFAHDGEELMRTLAIKTSKLPSVIFLDLNMPRKNGFQCFSEIKSHSEYDQLPIIIISTSFDPGLVHYFFQNGARYYIRKPCSFSALKVVIHQALWLLADGTTSVLPENQFVLSSSIN